MTDERMKAQWFRWHHGTTTDRKWPSIALRARTSVAAVIAVWACLLESASQNDDRGYVHVSDDDADDLDAALGLEPDTTRRIVAEMSRRDIVTGENRVAAWDKRQPKREREDKTATERKRRQRERERAEVAEKDGNDRQAVDTVANVTPCHATGRHDTPRGEERRVEEIKATAGNETLSLSPAGAGQGSTAGTELVGSFEGHDDRPTSPEVRARLDVIAKARALGCGDGLTAKDLDPYIAAGGTPEHFATVAGWSSCEGKGGKYVLKAACTNLAENPPQVAAGTNVATIGGQPQRLGKTASAIVDMEAEIRGLAQG